MENNITYDATSDESMEKRNSVSLERDDSSSITIGEQSVGKITNYKFRILIRDKDAFVGSLSREQMNLIYSLYSSEGANLSQREVSRYFPNYTFQEFKRILRAFNITKASAPLAPHIIEEKNPDELVNLTLSSKENFYLKKLEHDRNRLTEARFKDIAKKYYDLLQEVNDFTEFIDGLEFKVNPIEFKKAVKVTNKTLIVYLSDMHIGAEVSGYSIYQNDYNFETAEERFGFIIGKIYELCTSFEITNLIVCNIGDSIDGYNGHTTRGGHALPQNMDNKDQYKNFLTLMLNFFTTLLQSGMFSSIKYYSVDGGNHDGDVGFMINKSLEACLAALNKEIEVVIFEKMIDFFKVQNHVFILSHGKDARDMFKNMPLVINDKWENQINEYIDYNDIFGSQIHFIKGDLHQSATTYGKRFRYKSVASFFGSSEWIHKNFGNTKAAVDFDILLEETLLESRLILN